MNRLVIFLHFFEGQVLFVLLRFVFAFKVLFSDLLALRFFVIVLNHHTTAANYFFGSHPLSVLQRPAHSPSFSWSPMYVKLIYCRPQWPPLASHVTVGRKHTKNGLDSLLTQTGTHRAQHC